MYLLIIILVCAVVFSSVIMSVHIARRKKKLNIDGKHVVVTGGSSGIGKAVAIEAARRGANVTIIARRQDQLAAAKEQILQSCIHLDKQRVHCESVDVSASYERVERAIMNCEDALGPITVLVNCAGTSISGKFEDIPLEEFQKMMSVNYLGTVNVIKAVIPGMKSRSFGRIVLVSSQAGLLGIYGYTAYSASKFALRGFAEALQMEVRPYNVCVTVAYPPDTDTPGFAEEEKTKPEETRLISQSAGLLSAEEVAADIFNDTLMGSFSSTTGFDGFIVSTLCAGFSPVTSLVELCVQVCLMGFLRLIASFYLYNFNGIVAQCVKKRDKTKKRE